MATRRSIVEQKTLINTNLGILECESNKLDGAECICAYKSHSTTKSELLCDGIQVSDYSFRRQSSCKDLHEDGVVILDWELV